MAMPRFTTVDNGLNKSVTELGSDAEWLTLVDGVVAGEGIPSDETQGAQVKTGFDRSKDDVAPLLLLLLNGLLLMSMSL